MLIASSEFVEAEGTRTQMGAFVEPTLVADDFSRVES